MDSKKMRLKARLNYISDYLMERNFIEKSEYNGVTYIDYAYQRKDGTTSFIRIVPEEIDGWTEKRLDSFLKECVDAIVPEDDKAQMEVFND